MNIEKTTMSLDLIHPNEDNPRTITEEKFNALVRSIKDAPWMLQLRTLVVDENDVVLGGNMRLRALKEAGVKEVDVQRVTGLSDEQKREFIIKDNVGFGVWDWDILANEWDSAALNDWGMDVWHDASLDGVFDDLNESTYDPEEKEPSTALILDFTADELDQVNDWLDAVGGTKEQAVFKALQSLANG